jgi:hypothetical protein
MTNRPENTLIEALKNVEVHGDIAFPHVHDPMTMVLREHAVQANLMRCRDALNQRLPRSPRAQQQRRALSIHFNPAP